jgi:hypothetical protein
MENLTIPESFNQPPQPALPPPNSAPEGYGPIHAGSGRPALGKRIAGALAALGALLAKAKALIFLLQKLKLLATIV